MVASGPDSILGWLTQACPGQRGAIAGRTSVTLREGHYGRVATILGDFRSTAFDAAVEAADPLPRGTGGC